MAKKRMINADLLDNDVFLDLSISAKALYFYLILKSDDDGMIAKPKSVVREIQASNEDLQALIDTRYVLSFPSGVICIKHWKMHNSIPRDRYKPTTYQEELSTLVVRTDGSYTERERLEKKKEIQKNETIVDDVTGYDYSHIDMEYFWDKTIEIYPLKSGSTVAKTMWLDKFIGVPPENAEWVAKVIFRAIKKYLKDYVEKYEDGREYKYVHSIENFFKKDFDHWFRKAEKEMIEEEKQKKESGDKID